MPILNDKEYECDFCHEIFNLVRDVNWNEDKIEEEYKKNFSGVSKENRDIVCDDCWEIVKPKR